MKRHAVALNVLLFLSGQWPLAFSVNAQDKLVKQLWFWPPTEYHVLDLQRIDFFEYLAFAPDGKILAGASPGGKLIMLWDTEKRDWLRTLNGFHGESFAISSDGKTIVAGGEGGVVNVWDVATGRIIASREANVRKVMDVEFSPDGRILASAGWGGWVNLWDTNTWSGLGKLDGHSWGPGVALNRIAFSPDGETLAIYSRRTIELYDLKTRRTVLSLTQHTGDITRVIFSPDGKFFASGSMDDTVILWDVKTGKVLTTLTGHVYGVWSIAMRPDGKLLASADNAGTIRFWNTQNGRLLYHYSLGKSTTSPRGLAFTPDGHRLAFGNFANASIWVYDVSAIREDMVSVGSEKSAAASNVQTEQAHAELKVGADEFGRRLFEILRNKNYEELHRIVFTDREWIRAASAEELGLTGENWRDHRRDKIRREVDDYHNSYFEIGAVHMNLIEGQRTTITSVEYVSFVPRQQSNINPDTEAYDHSHLIVRINGSIEKRIEIDDVRVVDGRWVLFELI